MPVPPPPPQPKPSATPAVGAPSALDARRAALSSMRRRLSRASSPPDQPASRLTARDAAAAAAGMAPSRLPPKKTSAPALAAAAAASTARSLRSSISSSKLVTAARSGNTGPNVRLIMLSPRSTSGIAIPVLPATAPASGPRVEVEPVLQSPVSSQPKQSWKRSPVKSPRTSPSKADILARAKAVASSVSVARGKKKVSIRSPPLNVSSSTRAAKAVASSLLSSSNVNTPPKSESQRGSEASTPMDHVLSLLASMNNRKSSTGGHKPHSPPLPLSSTLALASASVSESVSASASDLPLPSPSLLPSSAPFLPDLTHSTHAVPDEASNASEEKEDGIPLLPHDADLATMLPYHTSVTLASWCGQVVRAAPTLSVVGRGKRPPSSAISVMRNAIDVRLLVNTGGAAYEKVPASPGTVEDGTSTVDGGASEGGWTRGSSRTGGTVSFLAIVHPQGGSNCGGYDGPATSSGNVTSFAHTSLPDTELLEIIPASLGHAAGATVSSKLDISTPPRGNASASDEEDGITELLSSVLRYGDIIALRSSYAKNKCLAARRARSGTGDNETSELGIGFYRARLGNEERWTVLPPPERCRKRQRPVQWHSDPAKLTPRYQGAPVRSGDAIVLRNVSNGTLLGLPQDPFEAVEGHTMTSMHGAASLISASRVVHRLSPSTKAGDVLEDVERPPENRETFRLFGAGVPIYPSWTVKRPYLRHGGGTFLDQSDREVTMLNHAQLDNEVVGKEKEEATFKLPPLGSLSTQEQECAILDDLLVSLNFYF
uniref:Uncharacterized protein n=1 Tax=Corethron hystrix TaxID=216773 RepID=A0A6U5EGN9_9STRA|mmetsp:Transcript_17844/g.40536  ORF Transcript_17844/g.40536 Transcript_17844/m.40536 type:complete len:773 (+) Transcript_17844:152-2470(+)